jgi:hypothetical protein
MCCGVRSWVLQGQVVVLGGSAGQNRHVYDPVNAWSTASCRAVVMIPAVMIRTLISFLYFLTTSPPHLPL